MYSLNNIFIFLIGISFSIIFINPAYASTCNQTVNVNACCENKACCPGMCTKLKKQINVLRWRLSKLEKKCYKTCTGKEELKQKLELINYELDILKGQNIDTQVLLLQNLEIIRNDLNEMNIRLKVLEVEEDLYQISPQIGLIKIWSQNCKDYLGLLIGMRIERQIQDKLYLNTDFELALGSGSNLLGLKLRMGLGVNIVPSLLQLEIGGNILWTDIDYMLEAQQLFLLGDIGLRVKLLPFFVSGHVLIGEELDNCKNCLIGGIMIYAGILF